MPRPVVEQKVTVSAIPAPESRAPQLGVYAPLTGLQAPQSSTFAGLANALGVLGKVGGTAMLQRADATAKADAAEGQADAELEQVDPERAARSRAYADAAHNTNIVRQYQDAEAATTEWAATNLDASKPFPEQTAAIDAEMKRRLGALAQDPRAKAIIAPRYQKFIEGAANGILSKQVEARANEAVDTVQRDIATDLANGGDGRYSEQVQRLTPLLGDRTKAVQRVVGMYIDHAVDVAGQGGDWRKVFASLPSDITLPDGTKIPGPGRSPALHDAIARGQDAAQRAYNGFIEPQRAQQQLHAMTQLDNTARHGGLITEAMLKPLITPGPNGEPPILSAAQAAGYMDRARDKAEQLAGEAAARQTLQLTPNWAALVGQQDPSDPKGKRVFSQEGFQRAYDQTLGMATQGFTAPDTVQQAIALTRQNPGLTSTNLKLQLAAAVNDPQAAGKMLPVFEALQDAKQAGQYLDTEQRTFYQTLAGKVNPSAPDAANTAAVMNTAISYDPERGARLIADNRKAVSDLVVKQVGGGWFGFGATKLDDFANAGQVKIDMDKRIADAIVATNGNRTQAAAIVNRQVKDDYVPIATQGRMLLIHDKYGEGRATVQANFDAISSELIPDLAKRAGLTREQAKEHLGWQVYPGAGGKAMVQVTDDMGQSIDSIAPFTLDWMMQKGSAIRQRNKDAARRDAAANAKAIEKANAHRRAGMAAAGRMQ